MHHNVIDQEEYQKAIKFAGEKHHAQMVPGCKANYLLHLSNVAMEVIAAFMYKPDFDLSIAIQLALLHDTVEDTDTDINEIETYFSKKIATGVQALTKDNTLKNKLTKMKDSLKRIKAIYKEVAIVKLADRITNLQPPPDHWDLNKVEKYKEEAKFIANELKGINLFLDQRIRYKIEEYIK